MPFITIEGPVIDDIRKKRELVKKVTDAAAEAYGFHKDQIVVAIKANLPENVSVGGILISDKR